MTQIQDTRFVTAPLFQEQWASDIYVTPAGLTQTTLAQALAAFGTGIVSNATATATGGTTSRTLAAMLGDFLTAKDVGMACDGMDLTDVTTTASSAVISSASHAFVAADVGKYITIAGAGAAAAVLNATISSVAGGNATLSATAGTSIAGTGVATFGTDDSATATAAVTALNTAGGGTLFLPTGIMVLAASITWKSKVSLCGEGAGKSVLKWISTGDMTSAVIQALAGDSTHLYTDCQFEDFEIDGAAATQASYNVAGKGIYIQYMSRPVFRGLYVHDTPATGLGVDFLQQAEIYGNTVVNCGRLNSGSNPGGAGIGIGVSSTFSSSMEVVHNNCVNNKRYGIFFETQDANAAVTSWVVCASNFLSLSATSGHGIGDAGLAKFVCVGNSIQGAAGCLDGISVATGTLGFTPGIAGLIADNQINACRNGIALDYTVAQSSNPVQYVVRGNRINNSATSGIAVTANASTQLQELIIDDNLVAKSNSAGIIVSGAAGVRDLTISGNRLANNALTTATINRKTGVTILCGVTRLQMVGNKIWDDNTGTQKFGLIVDGAVSVTGAQIAANDLSANNTGAISLTNAATLAGELYQNKGYNPQGVVAVPATASPMTYTAGATPEVLYISGGTVSDVSKNAISIYAATNCAVTLDPNEAVVITYTGAPTLNADRK